MGRKGYLIPEIIEINLITGEKTGKDLKKLVNNELGFDIPMHFQKSFDHGLIKLLEEEKIKIIGYDKSCDDRKVKQAFKSDTIIFDSSKRFTRPDINDTLNKMNIDNDAYQKIRFLFKSRLNDYNEIEKKRWDHLNSYVFCLSPLEIKNILSRFYNIKEIYNKIENLSEKEEIALFSWRQKELIKPNKEDANILNLFDNEIEEVLCGSLLRIISSYNKKEIKIWFYPSTTEEFENNKFDHNLPDLNNLKSINPNPNDKRFSSENNTTYLLLLKPFMIDLEGTWNKQMALSQFGFYEPNYVYDFDDTFENTVDIISTYSKEEKLIINEILAKGLSDEPGSKQIFWDLTKKFKKVNYKDRINRVLGMFEDDNYGNKENISLNNLSKQDGHVIQIKKYLKRSEELKDLTKPIYQKSR